MDKSGSVTQYGWEQAKQFANQIVDSLIIRPDAARVGVVTFSDFASLDVPPGSNQRDAASLKAAISAITHDIDGKTATTAALNRAAQGCFGNDRPDVIKIVVFLSDGMPTEDVDNLPNAIINLHMRAQVVISIGVGPQIMSQTLIDIAKRIDNLRPLMPGQDYFKTPNFTTLQNLVQNLAPRICPPIQPPVPPPACPQPISLCLVLDRSGSVAPSGWTMTLDFIEQILMYLTIGQNSAHVGVITFAGDVQVDIPTGTHRSNPDLIDAIKAIQYTGGETNTPAALNTAATRCFPLNRPNIPKVVIVITDGVPTIDENLLPIAIGNVHSVADVVVSIGVGPEISPDVLLQIAETGDGREPQLQTDYFVSASFDALRDLTTRLAPTVCPPVVPTLPPEPICNQEIDVCVVLDRSGSVTPAGWTNTIEFVTRLIQELTISVNLVRMGVITFATEASLDIPLGSVVEETALIERVRTLVYTGGETNTAAALALADNGCFRSNGDRSNVPNVVVFLTDAMPTIGMDILQETIDRLHLNTRIVVSIGVGPEIDVDTLARIAKNPQNMRPPVMGRDYYRTPDFTTLPAIVSRIGPTVCPTPPTCTSAVDICLVLDGSRSVRLEGWNRIKEFVTSIVQSLTVSPDQVRIGVVTFATNAALDIPLGTHFTNQDVIEAINRLQYREGPSTNTAEALTVTANRCFGGANDRSDVLNVVLVLTDGIPTRNEDGLTDAITTLHGVAQIVAAIGVGPELLVPVLANISKRADSAAPIEEEDYFRRPTFDRLRGLVTRITPRVCPTPPLPLCGARIDVCFILDRSGSVTQPGWEMTLQFVNRIVETLVVSPDQVQVAVITFASAPMLEIQLGTHSNNQDLMQAISQLPYTEGETNTAAALLVAASVVFQSGADRSNADNYVIILTDGMPTINQQGLSMAVEVLHAQVQYAASIGVGPDIDPNIIIQLAKTTNRAAPQLDVDYFISPDFDELQDLAMRIAPRVCPPPEPAPCSQALDVCLVLDSSGSVQEEGWRRVLEFANKFARCFTMSATGTQIGVVSFSNFASVRIGLGQYSNIEDLQNAISLLRWVNGWTNTAAALVTTAEQCFTRNNDRPNAKNVVIFISDGSPTLNENRLTSAIQTLHAKVDRVISIGVGTEITYDVLRRIAKTGDSLQPQPINGTHILITPSFETLSSIVSDIVEVTCIMPAEPPSPPIEICRQAADICFMLDRSGSETDEGWLLIKMAALNLINTFTSFAEFPHIGVITFSDHAILAVPPNLYSIPDLQSRIRPIPFRNGYTNIAGTLSLAATDCFSKSPDRRNIKNVAIFVSDATTTVHHGNVPAATRRLHDVTNFVIGLGIGVDVNNMSLRNISKRQDGGRPRRGQDYFVNPNSADLNVISQRILSEVCDEGDFTPAPTPAPPPAECRRAVDVCLILDSSSTVEMIGWLHSLRFAQDLVNRLEMSPYMVHLGVVSFSSNVDLSIPLGSLPFRNDMINRLSSLPFLTGSTNIPDALNVTTNECFSFANDRLGVQNAVAIITDGNPTLKQEQLRDRIRQLHSKVDVMTAVGVGSQINETLLSDLTKTYPPNSPKVLGRNYFLIDNFMALQTLVDLIVSLSCPQF